MDFLGVCSSLDAINSKLHSFIETIDFGAPTATV